jgi:hypothetical protein
MKILPKCLMKRLKMISSSRGWAGSSKTCPIHTMPGAGVLRGAAAKSGH